MQHIDFTWALSHYLNLSGGFNNLLHQDISSMGNICYLTTINDSTANKDIVYETMIQSKKKWLLSVVKNTSK